MKAIILNYCIGAVEIAELPEYLFMDDESGRDNSEILEDYMQDELGINLSEINYMIVDDKCPVYPIDKDEPIAIL